MKHTKDEVNIENYTPTDIDMLLRSMEEARRRKEQRALEKQGKKRRRIRRFWRIFAVMLIVCVVAWVCYAFRSAISDIIRDFTERPKSEERTAAVQLQKAVKSEPEAYTFESYSHLPYSIEAMLERYEEYRLLNPQMDIEDVVWRVNANLDKEKYGYDVEVSDYDDPHIIVNKYYKVPDDFEPSDLESFDGYIMRTETGKAYTEMKYAALDEGLTVKVVSAYRTVEFQKGLYESYLKTDSFENVERYSARPGYSEHHTGMAIDLFGSRDGLREFVNTPEYVWIKDNCHKYGFIIRYPEDGEEITGYEFEPWHLRYVGTEISNDMKEKNISAYEEYYAKYLMNKQN